MNTRCKTCGRDLSASSVQGFCPHCLLEDIALGEPAEEEVALSWVPLDKSATQASGQARTLDLPGYDVLEELGRGGMGIVYRARQRTPPRDVALKMLLPHFLRSDKLRQRFCQEVVALSRLAHPAILPVYAAGEYDGLPWFTMKLAGQSLAQRRVQLHSHWRAIAELMATLAEAVHHAHEHGVLHRDLKPSNILFDEAGQAYVADFGLAKLIDFDSDLSLTHGLLGTPNYLAPEIAKADARAATTLSDVYGLGAILHELLTGLPPHRAPSQGALMTSIAEASPFLEQAASALAPQDLRVICLKCLAKLPQDRYRTANELSEELHRFRRGEPITARPLTKRESLMRWVRQKPGLAASLALCTALLLWISVSTSLSAHRINVLRLEALRQLYAADMHRAFKAVAESKWSAADELLLRHRPVQGQPDLRGFEWYHLKQLCAGDQAADLGRTTGPAQRSAFSPDGKLVAAASSDLVLWTFPEGRLVARYPLSELAVGLCFSPDSRELVVSTEDGAVQILAIPARGAAGGKPTSGTLTSLHVVGCLTNQTGEIQAIAWPAQDGPLQLFGSESALCWSGRTDAPATESSFGRPFARGSVLPDGSLFAAFTGRTAAVWRPGSRTAPTILPLANASLGLGIEPHGRALVTGDTEGNLTVWNLLSNTVVRVIPAHRGTVERVAFSSTGTLLASAGLDQVIRIFVTKTWELKETLRGQRRNVVSLAFSPDERWLVSGAYDGSFKLWDLQKVHAHAAEAEAFAWAVLSPDASCCFGIPTNKLGGKLTLQAGLALATWGQTNELITRVLSRSSSVAKTVLGFDNGDFGLLQSDGRCESPKFPPSSQLLALSPDGRVLLYRTQTNEVLGLWDFSTASTRYLIGTDGGIFTRPVFSGDSSRFGLCLKVGEVRVYAVSTGKLISTLRGDGMPYSLSFSPDGKRLVTAGFERSVRLWDVDSGRLLGQFQSDVEIFWSVALAPDGRRIAAGTPESSVVLWDVKTREEVAAWSWGEPLRPVEGVLSFTPDGATLAFCDGRVLWTWRSGDGKRERD